MRWAECSDRRMESLELAFGTVLRQLSDLAEWRSGVADARWVTAEFRPLCNLLLFWAPKALAGCASGMRASGQHDEAPCSDCSELMQAARSLLYGGTASWLPPEALAEALACWVEAVAELDPLYAECTEDSGVPLEQRLAAPPPGLLSFQRALCSATALQLASTPNPGPNSTLHPADEDLVPELVQLAAAAADYGDAYRPAHEERKALVVLVSRHRAAAQQLARWCLAQLRRCSGSEASCAGARQLPAMTVTDSKQAAPACLACTPSLRMPMHGALHPLHRLVWRMGCMSHATPHSHVCVSSCRTQSAVLTGLYGSTALCCSSPSKGPQTLWRHS